VTTAAPLAAAAVREEEPGLALAPVMAAVQ